MFSSIGNWFSNAYHNVANTVSNIFGGGGFRAGTSQSATALNYNNPANNALQTSHANPSLHLPISAGGYSPAPNTPGFSSAYNAIHPTSVSSGTTTMAGGGGGGGWGGSSSSSYSSPSYSTSYASPTPSVQMPTSTSVAAGSLGAGTPSVVMPSAPVGTNYHGAVVGNNVTVGANPATGLIDTTAKTNPDQTPVNATATQNTQTSAQDALDKYLAGLKAPPSQADAYNRAQTEAGLFAAQQQKNNTQNAINGITTKMNTDLLNLRGTAGREGVTEAVYGGQQAEVTREATIQLLPLQAQLAVDQGNLELARTHTDTLFKIYATDAQNSVDYYNQNLKAVYDLSTKAEQRQYDAILAQKQTNADSVKTSTANQTAIANKLLEAGDMAGYRAVTAVRPPTNMQSPTFAQDYANYQKDLGSVVTQYGGSIGAQDRAYKAAQIKKMNADALLAAQQTNDSTVSVIDGNGNPVSIPTSAAPYMDTTHSGVNYVDASTLQGTAKEKKVIIDEAYKAGLKVVLNKNSALDLTNIKDANSKIETTLALFSDIGQPDALSRDLYGYGLTSLGILAQTNPKAAISQSAPIIGLDLLKGISGVQGFRGNQSAIQQVQDHLPKATDTLDVITGKMEFIKKLLDDRENAIVGKPKTSKTTATTSSDMVSVQLPDGRTGTIPKSNLEAALKAGAKQI